MGKNIIDNAKDYLKKKYDCHSVILYGSFANGTYSDESDIDIICFCDNTEPQNDTAKINGRQLDAWIYHTKMMEEYEKLLHINGGKILLDEKQLCYKLLENINKFIKEGAKKLTPEQIEFQKNWLKKMINRARRGDTEGGFRYHWLLVDSLEIYFSIKGLWYLGPKKSLIWLKENDKYAYKFFRDALGINASFEKAEQLVDFILNS